MDMLASFFAGSYAVYNRMNPQRRQEMYSNFGCYPTHIPQLIPLQTVSNARMPIVSEHEIVEKKTKPDESKPSFSGKEKMKFSIDSILNETPDDLNEAKNSSTIMTNSEINVVDSDDTDDDDGKLPWLQCTRYKPPKLSSKCS